MPKNKGKGGKNRKKGKNENLDQISRELVRKNKGQDYGQVIRVLGGRKIDVFCFGEGKTKICQIRGNLNQKVWININDIVLVNIRSFEDKGDIFIKYTEDEARQLQVNNEIPRSINFSGSTNTIEEFELISFGHEAKDACLEKESNIQDPIDDLTSSEDEFSENFE